MTAPLIANPPCGPGFFSGLQGNKKENYVNRYYFTGSAHSDVGWSVSHLAAQQELGLLPEWRSGPAGRYFARPGFGRQDLSRAGDVDLSERIGRRMIRMPVK